MLLNNFFKYPYTISLPAPDPTVLSAAGDGCFFIGLGGKNVPPTSSAYDSFQCCPSKAQKGSKVAKASPMQSKASQGASRGSGASTGSSRARGRSAKLQDDVTGKSKKGSTIGSAVAPAGREKSSKGKKGLGKFIWWW